jgi:hypothetical protein
MTAPVEASASLDVSQSSLQMSIPEYGLGMEEFVLPVWKPGDLVCAQWDEDRCWYKVRSFATHFVGLRIRVTLSHCLG